MLQKSKPHRKDEVNDSICSVIVAAAGASTRMEGINKLFVELDGKPVLAHTLTALEKCRKVSEIIVVTRAEDIDAVAQLCTTFKVTKISKIIPGGETRLESVYNGVLQANQEASLIAVHDGARPFITESVLSLTIDAALKFSAAAPAVAVTSTIKQAKNGLVVKTIDRAELFEIQTPQVFDAGLIKGALQNAINKSLYITDDCMAVEALGCPVKLTTGSRENIKLTTATDLAFAEAILTARRNKM